MLIFTEAIPPQLNPLVTIVIQQEVEPAKPTEPLYTLKEQLQIDIDTNVNNCDESLYWISAENATCLAKPVYVPVSRQSTPQTIVRGSNATNGWYPYGQCTYFVSTQRSVGQWNNAISWTWQAQRDGWSTGSTPQVGAIGQKGNHVVFVTGVNSNGTFNLSEMNYSGLGVITYRTVSSSGWSFIY